MSEAFVYCWTDFGTNKLYIGVHKGTTNDGYVCSSKHMNEEYKKRSEEFSRDIIAHGSFKEMYKLETVILKSAKAAKDPGFYNLSNNVPKAPKNHTNVTKSKMSTSRLEYMKTHKQTMKKEHHPMWGTHHSKEHCEKIRSALSGKKRSTEAKKNAGAGRSGYYQITTPLGGILCIRGLVRFCKIYKLHLSNLFNRGKSKGFLCKKLVKNGR